MSSDPPSNAYVQGLIRAVRQIPPPRRDPVDLLLLGFKAEAERSSTKLFELTKFSHEEVARTLLLFYLTPRGYAEARLGAGQGDVIIPDPSVVIETKIVRSRTDVEAGAAQLAQYLRAEQRPGVKPQGFLVLVAQDSLPSYSPDIGDVIRVDGWEVRVIWLVIPTESPSIRGRRLARAQARPRATRSRRRASSSA